MNRHSSAPKLGPGLALGLLLAAAGGVTNAQSAPAYGAEGARQFELIPSTRAAELPPELRIALPEASPSAALGLATSGGAHKVRLHWLVRESQPLSGYRLTLVSARGLPGNLAARWLVSPEAGIPVAGGLTAYSTEIILNLATPALVAAELEAVDAQGQAVVLGVRRATADPDPVPARLADSRSPAVSAAAGAVFLGRLAPSTKAATLSTDFAPQPRNLNLGTRTDKLDRRPELGGPVPQRGPPEARVRS